MRTDLRMLKNHPISDPPLAYENLEAHSGGQRSIINVVEQVDSDGAYSPRLSRVAAVSLRSATPRNSPPSTLRWGI